jgi:predicted nucleic acid-binding protein
MNKYLLDTNVLIYYFNGEISVQDIFNQILAEDAGGFYSPITWVELLCYPGLTETEANLMREFLQTLTSVSLTESVLDIERIERNARFHIHGASTIPGEAVKARDFLNHILEFKGKFLSQLPKSNGDTFFKLEKLKEMKDKGLITESEFQAKKRDLLDEL